MNEIITFISHIAFDYLVPVVLAIGLIVAVFSSILCLHFNYHYFLIHGKILWDMASERPSEVSKVDKLTGLKWNVGVSDAVMATAIITFVGILAAITWPIVLIFTLMVILLQTQKFIFRGRHRKLMFELKLKGLYNDRDS